MEKLPFENSQPTDEDFFAAMRSIETEVKTNAARVEIAKNHIERALAALAPIYPGKQNVFSPEVTQVLTLLTEKQRKDPADEIDLGLILRSALLAAWRAAYGASRAIDRFGKGGGDTPLIV